MENAPKYEIGRTILSDLDGIAAIENVSFPTPWPRRVLEREILSKKYYNESDEVRGHGRRLRLHVDGA